MKNTTRTALLAACALLPALALLAGQPASVRDPVPSSAATASPQAVCDIYRASEALLSTPRYRDSATERLTALAKPVKDQEAALQAAGKELDNVPNDQRNTPEWNRRVASFNDMKNEFDRARFRLQADSTKYLVSVNAQAYEEILGAARAVAARRGYTWVFASQRVSRGAPDTPDSFMREVMQRPAIIFPTEHDITDDVFRELKLDPNAPSPQPAAATPGSAPAARPPAAPTTQP